MAMNVLSSGIGGASGPALVTDQPLFQLSSAAVTYYVGPGGVDAAAPAGYKREQPLATLNQAVTNANTGDIIVFLPNHAENIAAAITIADADLTIVSEGVGTSRARLTCTGAGINMLDVTTGAGLLIQNVFFPASTGAGSSRIRIAAAGVKIQDCAFEAGASDSVEAVSFVTGWGNCRIADTTFTVVASRPDMAIEVVNAGSRLFMDHVTFDGGAFGWNSSGLTGTAAVTGLMANIIDQLNGSDVFLAASTTGWWLPGTCTGGSIVYGGS